MMNTTLHVSKRESYKYIDCTAKAMQRPQRHRNQLHSAPSLRSHKGAARSVTLPTLEKAAVSLLANLKQEMRLPVHVEATSQGLLSDGTSAACPPKKKAVKFSTKVRVKVVPRKTDEQLANVWSSAEEQKRFAEKAMKVAKLRRRCCMSENEFEDKHNDSSRGLEHFRTKGDFLKRTLEKENVIEGVLLHQESMLAQGLPHNHEELFHTSHILSAAARERARTAGREDALAHLSVHLSER